MAKETVAHKAVRLESELNHAHETMGNLRQRLSNMTEERDAALAKVRELEKVVVDGRINVARLEGFRACVRERWDRDEGRPPLTEVSGDGLDPDGTLRRGTGFGRLVGGEFRR